MPWWNATSQDSTNTRAGTSADTAIDLRAMMKEDDIAANASRGRALSTTKPTHSKSIKRSQTSPDMSEQETSTKRAKDTNPRDESLEHSQASTSGLLEMTKQHGNSKASVKELEAIISRQAEEIQQFQTELCTARVKELEHTEHDEAERTINGLRSRNSELSDRIRQHESHLRTVETKNSIEKLELDLSNCDLKQGLFEMTQKHDDLQTLASDLEELNSVQREEIKTFTDDLFTARNAYAVLENTKHDEVEAATTSLRALNATQSVQIEQLEKDQQAAEAKYKKLEQRRDKLKDKLESARLSGTKRALRQHRAYRRLKHDTNSARAELETVAAERDELSAKLSETETHLVEATNEPREHEEDNEPEDCLVVVCVDISDDGPRCLEQIRLAYGAIIMFLQARWGDDARVAVIVHGGEESVAHEAHKIDYNTWQLVVDEAPGGDHDYNFCISKAKDILARNAASKKVIVMIGGWQDITFDEAGLENPIAYLRSHDIPAHSIVVGGGFDDDDMYTPLDAHPSLTRLIGGRKTDHASYCCDLEDLLGRE